jgi:hypothetical protein
VTCVAKACRIPGSKIREREIIKVTNCAICASDSHLYRDLLDGKRRRLGHETSFPRTGSSRSAILSSFPSRSPPGNASSAARLFFGLRAVEPEPPEGGEALGTPATFRLFAPPRRICERPGGVSAVPARPGCWLLGAAKNLT